VTITASALRAASYPDRENKYLFEGRVATSQRRLVSAFPGSNCGGKFAESACDEQESYRVKPEPMVYDVALRVEA